MVTEQSWHYQSPNTELKTTKCLIQNSKNSQIFLICLPNCPITYKRLQRLNDTTHAWSPDFAAITNLPLECAFLGSVVCLPSAPCSFFYVKDYCHLLLRATAPQGCVSNLDRHFPYQAPQNYLGNLVFQVKHQCTHSTPIW